MEKIISDIQDTIDALSCGYETEYTKELKIKRVFEILELIYSKNMSEEQIKVCNDNRPTTDDMAVELIIDFYKRFIYRMKYMIQIGKENGCNLISFSGP